MNSANDDRSARIQAAIEHTQRVKRRMWIMFGILVAMAVAAVVVLLVDKANHAERLAAGTRAVARVERLAEGFCWVGESRHRCMDIELEVHPSDRPPFTTVVTHNVADAWMSRVQPGQWLTVVVDNGTAEALIDDALFELPPPPPAR
jgi:hypothetical protein